MRKALDVEAAKVKKAEIAAREKEEAAQKKEEARLAKEKEKLRRARRGPKPQMGAVSEGVAHAFEAQDDAAMCALLFSD